MDQPYGAPAKVRGLGQTLERPISGCLEQPQGLVDREAGKPAQIFRDGLSTIRFT